jgi:predicted  nucleic acid-binding Zn-ribbon protein
LSNPNKPGIPTKYEEERLRAAEQSQMVYLQGQIDELRRLLKEQNNKYSWTMEQVRKAEGGVAQVEGLFERFRNEVTLVLDGVRRDVATLRKEVAGALVKIEEGVRPLREMQAQIQQLGEARRQDRDAVAGWLSRIEGLEQRTVSWQSELKETDDRHRALTSQLEGLYSADESVRAEIRKIGEELQVEKQSLRRQAVEAQQLVADIRPLIEAQASRIARLDELRQQIDTFAEQLPAQVAALDVRIAEAAGEIKRVERISTERFLMGQERVEEVRRLQDDRIATLEEVDQANLRQLTTWIERIDSWVRELEQRQSRSSTQIGDLQRDYTVQLNDLEQRDVQLIDVMITALRARLETIRAEQVERGRVPQNGAP